MSMRIKRYGDWIEYITESGRTFYYNDKDGSFQWEPPFATDHTTSKVKGGGSGGGQNKRYVCCNVCVLYSSYFPIVSDHHALCHFGQYLLYFLIPSSSVATTSTTTTNPQEPEEHNAHYPWRAYIDPESGSVFWYNEVTFVSQWELPVEFEAEAYDAVSVLCVVYYVLCVMCCVVNGLLISARAKNIDELLVRFNIIFLQVFRAHLITISPEHRAIAQAEPQR